MVEENGWTNGKEQSSSISQHSRCVYVVQFWRKKNKLFHSKTLILSPFIIFFSMNFEPPSGERKVICFRQVGGENAGKQMTLARVKRAWELVTSGFGVTGASKQLNGAHPKKSHRNYFW